MVLAGSAGRPLLVRATDETARFITTQLELADLAVSRADLARAEVRALRAQISPHFIYNALTTIAAFVRSDPDRARELLLEFADFPGTRSGRPVSSPRWPTRWATSRST